MAEIQQIVDALNKPPFNIDISLVSFSRKSPLELRQLLNDVFAAIDKKQERDLRDELPEATNARMLELLRVLKYRPQTDGATFRQGLANGSSDVLYPLLAWLLPQISLLQKRAYLSAFLVDVDVPEELLMDEEVSELMSHVKALQAHFKDTHRQVEGLRRTNRDPLVVKKQIEELEGEREHLTTKIAKIKTKLQSVPKLNTLMEVAGQLRRQTEEESQLGTMLAEQKAALDAAAAKQAKVAAKLRDMRASMMSGSASALLQQLAEEVSLNRYTVQEKLPKEIEKRKQRLAAIQSVLSEPINSEQDIVALQADLQAANTALTLLVDKKAQERLAAATGAGGGEGGAAGAGVASDKELAARQQAQMAALVRRKKEAMFTRLAALSERKRQLLWELETKQAEAQQAKQRVPQGSELQHFEANVRAQDATYRQMRRRLDDLAAETEVLQHTQVLLERQEAELQGVLQAARGSAVGGGGGREDGRGGASLEDMRSEAIDLEGALQEQKQHLTPLVKERQGLRAALQELEEEHAEKKRHFEDATAALERQTDKMKAELAQCLADSAGEESRYHQLNNQMRILDAKLQKVLEEQGGGGTGLKSLSDKYRARIVLQEEQTRNLKERQRQVKESEEPNQQQRAMLTDVRALLACKLQLYQRGGSRGGDRERGRGNPAIELRDADGANRLVIGQSL